MKLAIIGSGMIVKDFLEIMPYLNEVELRAIYGRRGSEEKLNKLKLEKIIELLSEFNDECI